MDQSGDLDLIKHSRQASCCIGASTESEHADPVAFDVVLHQEAISAHHLPECGTEDEKLDT